MKITGDQVNPVAQGNPGKTDKMKTTEAEGALLKDRVDISARAADIDAVREIIAGLPEVRADKVEALRLQIQDGTYKVDPDHIAEKLLTEIRLSKPADD